MALAIHAERAMLPTGWADDVRLTVADGLIATVTAGVPATPGDERAQVLVPGLPNLHSHAFQRGMAGLAERRGDTADSFWTWREAMYRFVDRVRPDQLQAIATLAYAEMLESGFTRVGEFHYLHHDIDGGAYADRAEMTAAIAAAAQASGIALTHLPVFYAHGGFGGAAAGAGQRRFLHDLEGFAALLERAWAVVAPLGDAVVGLAPHSLRAVTEVELGALVALAGDAPIHIHIAEQVREVADCVAWSGQRPVEWLLGHAPVDARWCLVHATHMTPGETAALAASGAVAGLCPITEANLGDGLFPADDFLAAGGRFGLGSDSNVLIDAGEEMRLLEYGQRLRLLARNVLADAARPSTGGAIFRDALAGGAQALGAGPAALAPGAAADLVALDGHHPALVARSGDALLDGWIFAAGRGAVDRVWRRGALLVSGGRHRDRDALRARYAGVLRDLLA